MRLHINWKFQPCFRSQRRYGVESSAHRLQGTQPHACAGGINPGKMLRVEVCSQPTQVQQQKQGACVQNNVTDGTAAVCAEAGLSATKQTRKLNCCIAVPEGRAREGSALCLFWRCAVMRARGRLHACRHQSKPPVILLHPSNNRYARQKGKQCH